MHYTCTVHEWHTDVEKGVHFAQTNFNDNNNNYNIIQLSHIYNIV